jgi:hypothetical protein
MLQTYHPEFLTATILNWKHLLAREQMKTIVVPAAVGMPYKKIRRGMVSRPTN